MNDEKEIYCLGIATSPRRGGNTSILLEKALEGASSVGARTEMLNINNFKFSPCLACDGCFKEGKCVILDDMQIIYEKLLTADRIILASPIFSMGLCAQAKAMVDRTQRFWSTKYILKQQVITGKNRRPERKGMLISAAGSDHKNVFDGAIQVAKYFFLMLETDFTGSFCYQNTDEKGTILRHHTALTEVYQAGRQLGQD